jgi:hypothetical protein
MCATHSFVPKPPPLPLLLRAEVVEVRRVEVGWA